MGALPTKKLSKTRTAKRRHSQRIDIPELVTCSHCKEKMLPHTVCQNCGYYAGKKMIEKEAKTKVIKA